MLEIIKELELYLLATSSNKKYINKIKTYFALFYQAYRELPYEDFSSYKNDEVYKAELKFQHINRPEFYSYFSIKNLAIKAKRYGQRIPVSPQLAPKIDSKIHNSMNKKPVIGSPIILLKLPTNRYLCVDGNHRLQSAFKQNQSTIGYIVKFEMLDSTDFLSKYDYYNFFLFWSYQILEENIQFLYTDEMDLFLHSFLLDVQQRLNE